MDLSAGDSSRPASCRRCGICCKADMVAYASDTDIRRWEREGRSDILSLARDRQHIWAGDRIIDADGSALQTCTFLSWNNGVAVCSIYETRPILCRNYIPGSSEICSQFYSAVRR
ncbi:MAG: YkgJ family cysteine cluster protein [Spirochaetes bacterium]|nr:YkgJ family cysteine cluster protein [Spirochaetota bacterium]